METCIVIATLSDDLDTIYDIQNKLLDNHLVSGCQIANVESTYWWNGEINKSQEYSLCMRTKESLYHEIEAVIKNMHNYEVPEISYYEINGSREMISWIMENTK